MLTLGLEPMQFFFPKSIAIMR